MLLCGRRKFRTELKEGSSPMTNPAITSLAKRRSVYAIGTNTTLSTAEIESLIKEAVRLAPSSFNSQSSRVVILFGEPSKKFWLTIAGDALRAVVPADQFAPTEAKLHGFAAGVGTVLFFEDQDVIKGLQEQFALYAAAFPGFSEHSAGMAQLAVWTALAEVGLGASLQHYSPLVDAGTAAEYGLPASWALKAQMPFGSIEGASGEKSFIEDSTRFKTFGN